MTKNFNRFISYILENVGVSELLEGEYHFFPKVDRKDKENGIFLDEWDLKNLRKFKEILSKADVEKKYIFAKADPYNTKENMIKAGATPERANEEYQKDKQRLVDLYCRRFGFIHERGGWIYRPPQSIQKEGWERVYRGQGERKSAGSSSGNGLYVTGKPEMASSYVAKNETGHVLIGNFKSDHPTIISANRKYSLEDLIEKVNNRGKFILNSWIKRGYYENGINGKQFVDEVIKLKGPNTPKEIGIGAYVLRDQDGRIIEAAIYNPDLFRSGFSIPEESHLHEMTDAGVLGTSGGEHGGALGGSDFFATGDARNVYGSQPNPLMISRRGRVRTKPKRTRKRRKRKHKKKS